MHVDFCVNKSTYFRGYHLLQIPQIGSTIYVRDSSKGEEVKFNGRVADIAYEMKRTTNMISTLVATIYLEFP